MNFKETGQRFPFNSHKRWPFWADIVFTRWGPIDPMWVRHGQFGLFLAESGTLPNQVTIVPTFIVRLFFGGGTLIEVYTDETIRILYGSNNDEFKTKYLYVMVRATN